MEKQFKRVQVILKVVERCNLACSYCYYFEGGDQTFKEKPAVIGDDTVDQLAHFLRKGAIDLGLDTVWIAFHGGEPMMLKPAVFDRICTKLREQVGSVCGLKLDMQTNGYHVTEEWLRLFEVHDVGVSFSIDGSAETHDKYRRTKAGKGSYERIKDNYVRTAKDFVARGWNPPSIISVLNANNNYTRTIEDLKEVLGVTHFNFLLPDCNHDDGVPEGFSPDDYGRVLGQIFDAWQYGGAIVVREIEEVLERFQLASEVPDESVESMRGRTWKRVANQIIVVRSDGELQIDDTFIPASDWRNSLTKVNIRDTTLRGYLHDPVFDQIDELYARLPDGCQGCVWANICNGGDLENRYSISAGFNNPSVYCRSLKSLYRRVALFLRRNGYSKDVMHDRLKPVGGMHKYRYAR